MVRRAARAEVVVLVEDDDGLRIALGRVLSARGFETRTYATAEAALADIVLERPDCLVVDVCLPGMSGLKLVEHLRQRGVGAAVIAMSAREEAQLRGEIERRGIKHFLAKPFLGSVLLRAVEDALGDRRLGGGAAV